MSKITFSLEGTGVIKICLFPDPRLNCVTFDPASKGGSECEYGVSRGSGSYMFQYHETDPNRYVILAIKTTVYATLAVK